MNQIKSLKSNFSNSQEKTIAESLMSNSNNENYENSEFFNRTATRHKVIKKTSSLFLSQEENSEDIISELKNENNEMQKTIEILKKKIYEGIKFNSKDLEFNENNLPSMILVK